MSISDYSARRFGGPVPPWLRDAETARPVPAEVWITGALVVIAAVIRIIVINDQSIWQDEALTAYEAQLPLGAMITTVVHVETTPPLYFVLIWAWAHVFGNGEVALRSVSMLAGVALVPISYLAARDLVSPRAGVFAAAFVTFNPFLIWYSQEARAYMLLAALCGASFLWFVRSRRDPSARNLVWWAVWSSLALMTHFFAGFLMAPEALWLVWVAGTRRAGAGLRVAGGAVGVVALVQVAIAFGQDAAITAGLTQATGAWTVVMDCDLQEAPEDIPRLWAAAGEGYDIVRTVRRGWRHSAFRRSASRLYRRLTLETDVRPDYSNLSLLSRRVVDAFLRLEDRDREYMIALDWLGFDSTAIEIEHHERHAGESGYTLRRLVRVALDGMFFRSTVLLRLVVLLGFLVAFAGIVVAGFEVADYFLEPEKSVPGYTSLAVLLLVLTGFIIVSVGVVGLYVGRIFEQVKNRPLFLIDQQAAGAEPSLPTARTPTRARPESETISESVPGSAPSRPRASPQ